MTRPPPEGPRINRILIAAFIGGIVTITGYRLIVGPATPPPRASHLFGRVGEHSYDVRLKTKLDEEGEVRLQRDIESELTATFVATSVPAFEEDATHLPPGTRLESTAVVTAYAVDRVASRLEAAGHENFRIQVEENLWARGTDPRDAEWTWDVADRLRGRVWARVALRRSGFARHGRVSVVDERCGRAKAWAATLDAMAPDEALKLAEREALAVFILHRDADGRLQKSQTEAFQAVRSLP